MHRGSWWSTVKGVAQSRTRPKDLAHTCTVVNGVENLVKCLLAICMGSSEKYPFKSFAHFITG